MKPTLGEREVRTTPRATLRAVDDARFQISGIAAAYNVKSSPVQGSFVEVIAPGAFASALKPGADVRCLFNHDPNKPLGRTKAGTLVLSDSPEGLRFVCQLDKTNSDHQNLWASIKRQDIDACSFGFLVTDDSWQDGGATDENGRAIPLRTLRAVQLLDVSAVVYPQYPVGTSVGARAAAAATARKKSAPSEIRDIIRRHQVAVIGDLVAADIRQMTVDEVSSYREYVKSKLTEHLASQGSLGGWRYIGHDNDHVYGVPDASFDPDWDDEEAMAHCARWNYQIENGEVVLTAFTTRWANEVDPKTGQLLNTNAAPTFSELRANAALRRKMEISAGRYRN